VGAKALRAETGESMRFVCQHAAWRKTRVKALFAEDSYLAGWQHDPDPGAQALHQPVTQVSLQQ
jgi:hypothetical protein